MKKIVNNVNEKIVSIDNFSPARDEMVVNIKNNGDICLLTKVGGFAGKSYGWIVMFNNFTEHNMYSGFDNWSIKEAIAAGIDSGDVFVVDSIGELANLIRGDGWGV